MPAITIVFVKFTAVWLKMGRDIGAAPFFGGSKRRSAM